MAAKKSSSPSRPSRPAPRPRKNASTKSASRIEVDPAWLEPPAENEKPKTSGKNTIPVKSAWLIPPLPDEAKRKDSHGKPPPPSAVAVKPRGKLPPPLPREDREDEPQKTKSKRPPRT